MAVGTIPTFALYGEVEDPSSADWVHCESIQVRSRQHNYKIQPHRHENLLQLLYLANGRAELVVDARQSQLEGPSVVILPPMVVHSYKFSPDVEGTVVTLFESRLAHLIGAEEIKERFRRVQVVALGEHADIAHGLAADLAALTVEISGRAEGRTRAIEARLTLILIALHRLEVPSDEGRTPGERGLKHAMRYRELVDRDFRKHQGIEVYARKLGISSTHLNRVSREHLNDTALGIIHNRLTVEAKRYLTFTTMNVKEIAVALAFEDPAYFARFFRQRTGISPLRFRLQKNAPTNTSSSWETRDTGSMAAQAQDLPEENDT